METLKYEMEVEYAQEIILAELWERKWPYRRKRTEAMVYFLMEISEKKPLDIVFMSVDGDNGVLEIASRLMEKVPEQKRPEMAIVINEYNTDHLLGMLEMDLHTGAVWYKIKISLAGCRIGREILGQLLDYIVMETGTYGELLRLLNQGTVSMNQVLQLIV